MTTPASALVVAHRNADRSAILLVKTRLGWGIPVGAPTESLDALRARIQHTLLMPGAVLSALSAPRREFSCAGTPVGFELAASSAAGLQAYPESEDWHAVRWASFEEAFHIIQADQDEVLKWCERTVNKVLEA